MLSGIVSMPGRGIGMMPANTASPHETMNRNQLQKLGIPPTCVPTALDALHQAASQNLGFGLKGKRAHELVKSVMAAPATYSHDPVWGKLAAELIGNPPPPPREPIAYRTWGDDIDPAAHDQMRTPAVCRRQSVRR